MNKQLTVLFSFTLHTITCAVPFPICFSLSETKVVDTIPEKDQAFASIIPGKLHTYIYTEESAYYHDYQRSYFAITCRKGGWDCLRHYEILANGCIPYFIDLDHCPHNTMHLLPKTLIWEAMHLPGVSQGAIDFTKFDKTRYYEILRALLEYVRAHLTTRAVAQYMLDTLGYDASDERPILFLACDKAEDYLKSCILIGLKELLPNKIVDVPRADYIYTDYMSNVTQLYGKGFSYSKIVEPDDVNRDAIEERIKNKEFSLIMYAYVHHGTPFHELVCEHYAPHQIMYMCGEDTHSCAHVGLHNFFLRENYY